MQTSMSLCFTHPLQDICSPTPLSSSFCVLQAKQLAHVTINLGQVDRLLSVFQTNRGILAKWIPVLHQQTCPTEALDPKRQIKRGAYFTVPTSICHAYCVQFAGAVFRSCCLPAKNAIVVGTVSMTDIWPYRPTGKITRTSSVLTDTPEGCCKKLNMFADSMLVARHSPVLRTCNLRDCLVQFVLCNS